MEWILITAIIPQFQLLIVMCCLLCLFDQLCASQLINATVVQLATWRQLSQRCAPDRDGQSCGFQRAIIGSFALPVSSVLLLVAFVEASMICSESAKPCSRQSRTTALRFKWQCGSVNFPRSDDVMKFFLTTVNRLLYLSDEGCCTPVHGD